MLEVLFDVVVHVLLCLLLSEVGDVVPFVCLTWTSV
jgi:hypothetical protein